MDTRYKENPGFVLPPLAAELCQGRHRMFARQVLATSQRNHLDKVTKLHIIRLKPKREDKALNFSTGTARADADAMPCMWLLQFTLYF